MGRLQREHQISVPLNSFLPPVMECGSATLECLHPPDRPQEVQGGTGSAQLHNCRVAELAQGLHTHNKYALLLGRMNEQECVREAAGEVIAVPCSHISIAVIH